ncbi:hypothetical protein J1614_011498 [Plenodomus biglobosus]|nr:hypothetical protein J1614_011498 [Plenodomus biglobosus]
MAHNFTLCRTPPIPRKNPKRYIHTKPLPPLPVASPIQPELLPQPLFSSGKKTRPQQLRAHTTDSSPSPVSSTRSSISTPTASSWKSCRSSIASDYSVSSTPATSVANSPSMSRTQSLSYTSAKPRTTWIVTPVAPDPGPKPSLRRKKTPRKDTLRSLREREMESLSEEGG